jgi:TatD DNase family protein
MLVDSHCHLADAAFRDDVGDVLSRAWRGGVGHLVVIGESPVAAEVALRLAESDSRISATAGLHPHEAKSWSPATRGWLRAALRDDRVVAAGEMGLDYHYDYSPRDVQRRVFEEQLDLAAEAGKPAVIHAREADDDVAAALAGHPRTVCILHSFSGGLGLLHRALSLGHYASFSGMITFKNWQADQAILDTPADRLLVETDAPYLAPVPHRGRRNEPAFVRQVAERVAAVRGLPVDEAVALTGANARRVFGHRLEKRQV